MAPPVNPGQAGAAFGPDHVTGSAVAGQAGVAAGDRGPVVVARASCPAIVSAVAGVVRAVVSGTGESYFAPVVAVRASFADSA